MYIPRLKDQEINEFIRDERPNKHVLLVEGARQVGKTSLVKNALNKNNKTFYSINLEKESLVRSLIDDCIEFQEFENILKDRIGFDGKSDAILFIDEAQESRKLGSFVRFMKEEWPKTTVILSGSTLTRLFRADTRYPVGRVKRLIIHSFSFLEFLIAAGRKDLFDEILMGNPVFSEKRHQYLLSLYDRFLVTGGLPEVVLSSFKNENFEEIRAQIIADYEMDFIRIFGEEDNAIVKACFKSVSNFVGGPSKNTTVVPSPSTHLNAKINQIFTRLESWHLILRAEQRGPGPEGSHNYLPKRYLFDTGVLRHFRESAVPSISVINTLSQATRTPLGGVIENQTAIELSRFYNQICGWKKNSSGGEIDFILKRGEISYPLECKASLTVNKRQICGILDYMNIYSLKKGFIVSLAPYCVIDIPDRGQIVNIPVYLLELLGKGNFD